MRIILGLLILCVLGVAVLGFTIRTLEQGSRASSLENIPVASSPQGAPVFTWEYKTSEDIDGIPQTEITLAAWYPGGMILRKGVDTIEGTCNEYPEPDVDVYGSSTMIICYYAGHGRYYKVVESNGAYLVQRKVFEEASPDYDPPVAAYETVVRF